MKTFYTYVKNGRRGNWVGCFVLKFSKVSWNGKGDIQLIEERFPNFISFMEAEFSSMREVLIVSPVTVRWNTFNIGHISR